MSNCTSGKLVLKLNPPISPVNMQQSSTTLIIGAGVFGLSFLDHITKVRPSDKAIAFDSGEKESAVNDSHKIIRRLYPSARRTEIATENQERWMTDPRLKKHYNPIGRIEVTDDVDKLDAIDSNLSTPRERHTEESIAKLLNTQTLSAREHRCFEFAASLLKMANDPSLCCLWNEDNAVIDWNPCMDDIRKPLRSKIQEAKVNRLVVGGGGLIREIHLEGGEVVAVREEDILCLAAGAWTEDILKESSITTPLKKLRCIGVFTFHLKLNNQHWEYVRDLPALSFQTRDMNCEFLPALTRGGLAKIGLTYPFTNEENKPKNVLESPLVYHALLRAKNWARKYYPGLEGAEVVSKEVHWDAVTEDQTPLIARHPDHNNLLIASGGSYTRAKDFPTIGRIIDNPSEEFGWNSSINEEKMEHNQPLLLTSDLFSDLNDAAARNPEVRSLMAQGTYHCI